MANPPPTETATRESWKTLPLPDARAALNFTEHYTVEEFERIARGLIPQAMEDKWFVFFEEPWLYFHRSWTGHAIYGVCFGSAPSGRSAVDAWVSRNSDAYTGTDTAHETALLKFLIDALLLGRPASFPVPGAVPANTPAGLLQHAVVGRAYPEVSGVPQRSRSGLLAWLRRLLGKG